MELAFPSLTPRETAFLRLHVIADDAHGATLLSIASELEATQPGALVDIEEGMLVALEGRASFWDEMLAVCRAMPPARTSPTTVTTANTQAAGGSVEPGVSAAILYDKQAHNWARTKPSCLSDFTARPAV